MSGQTLSDLVEDLVLLNHQRARNLVLDEAVADQPTIKLTMDGANTLDVPVVDAERKVLRSPLTQYRSWAEVAGVRFELVGFSKIGSRFTLHFEDGIAAALRRRTKPLSAPAGSTTRQEFAIRLAREAKVPYAVDPTKRAKVSSVLERSAAGQKTNSWDVLGDMAEAIHWRRFSTGTSLVVGGDEWLMERDRKPIRLREHAGGVHDIDFDLDIAKRVSEATLTVDSKLWTLRPGSVCTMGDDMGPAEGKWLVGEFTRPLASTRATVRLIRARHVLKEPKRSGPGDLGDPDFVPGSAGSSGGGAAANAARERMVRFALSQAGDAYVWGGNGPSGWDCSGLVYAATRVAGRQIPARTSAGQWAACQAAGRTIAVSTALRIRGALLFIQTTDTHHVAICLGNGSTVEAKGSAYGTGVFGGAAGGGWTGAALWV
ncbi:NlpC/P60 family protein [Nocardioides sp.]|uniref:C40 family peptidase n=1 Tax=Nocardioides sp. TaxID=35761 RepID=UPI002619D1BC|nr:NlpC/P60 family protein [Nocardioides sp.]MDI6911486.1 NlpC/P60 family protein [Nocardioides sp.]